MWSYKRTVTSHLRFLEFWDQVSKLKEKKICVSVGVCVFDGTNVSIFVSYHGLLLSSLIAVSLYHESAIHFLCVYACLLVFVLVIQCSFLIRVDFWVASSLSLCTTTQLFVCFPFSKMSLLSLCTTASPMLSRWLNFWMCVACVFVIGLNVLYVCNLCLCDCLVLVSLSSFITFHWPL